MTTKHTPGPWSVSKYGDDYNITYNTDGNWLATVYDDDDPFAGRPEADAHLIAAAPELLEALKAIQLQALQSSVNSAANEWGREALDLANAAIAKAEGRT